MVRHLTSSGQDNFLSVMRTEHNCFVFVSRRGARMSGGGGAGLMSCVREGSLEPPYRPPHTDTHNHGKYYFTQYILLVSI